MLNREQGRISSGGARGCQYPANWHADNFNARKSLVAMNRRHLPASAERVPICSSGVYRARCVKCTQNAKYSANLNDVDEHRSGPAVGQRERNNHSQLRTHCNQTSIHLTPSVQLQRGAREAEAHIEGGCKKVVISTTTPMYVTCVNHKQHNGSDPLVSNGPCTTSCLAPLAKAINDNFGARRLQFIATPATEPQLGIYGTGLASRQRIRQQAVLDASWRLSAATCGLHDWNPK
ncbi:hypothetical protein PHYPSEUDO_004956 [Phytophthora pseudosyringae]|uniref:Uncharacterized protein n=1 Tax=Phytophthora pseudosyringae TaxID=221518 RepID=A0A8T1WDZ4_9STRA|nr:hypothetical protein PHYPSEUDO_004956 [Phytophthora pseudosyringae]